MGVCNSIAWLFQKNEDLSIPDMKCAHECNFCSFIKHYCENMQGNEEQNPLAVMRLPEKAYLIEQLKKWIAKKLPGAKTVKISPPVRQELIYKTPGASQQMGVTCYSFWLQIENRSAFYQGQSQMLIRDGCVPPRQMVTGGGGWCLVSMEVVVDKADQGGRCLDNRNPELHLKVTLHVANDRTTQSPTGTDNVDPGVMTENCDVHLQTETYRYDNVLKHCSIEYREDNTLSTENVHQLNKLIWLDLNLNDPNRVNSIIPNQRMSNSEAIYDVHRDQNTNGKSKKCPPPANIRTGDHAPSVIRPLCLVLLLLAPAAGSVSKDHQIKLHINQDLKDHQNCTLMMDACYICYGHCDQNIELDRKICNVNDSNPVQMCCEQQMHFMNSNKQLLEKRNLPSGSHHLILSWNVNESFNVTNWTIRYIFNGEELTEQNISNLPISIFYTQPKHLEMNDAEFMSEINTYVAQLGQGFMEMLRPFLRRDIPETKTRSRTPIIFSIAIFIVLVICLVCLEKKEWCDTIWKKTLKLIRDGISKIQYGLAAQTDAEAEAEAEGDPSRMEEPEVIIV